MYRTFLTREMLPIARGRYGHRVLDVPTTLLLGANDLVTKRSTPGRSRASRSCTCARLTGWPTGFRSGPRLLSTGSTRRPDLDARFSLVLKGEGHNPQRKTPARAAENEDRDHRSPFLKASLLAVGGVTHCRATHAISSGMAGYVYLPFRASARGNLAFGERTFGGTP